MLDHLQIVKAEIAEATVSVQVIGGHARQ